MQTRSLLENLWLKLQICPVSSATVVSSDEFTYWLCGRSEVTYYFCSVSVHVHSCGGVWSMPTGKGIYKLKMCGIACSLNRDDLTLKVLLQLQIQNKSSVGRSQHAWNCICGDGLIVPGM